MTITYPRTDILNMNFTDQVFQLKSRQEFSTLASGIVRGKDLGSAIWMANYTTWPIPNNEALAYEAALNSLDGVIRPFEAYDLRRPTALVAGTTDATLSAVNSNTRALTLTIATGSISAGDYLSFDYGGSRALHQAMQNANSGQEFEVRPYIRPGFTISAAVKLTAPRGLFTLLPGSVTSKANGGIHTVISFQAGQFL